MSSVKGNHSRAAHVVDVRITCDNNTLMPSALCLVHRTDIQLGGPWSTCCSTENLTVLLILLMIIFVKLNNPLSLPGLFDLWPSLFPAQLVSVFDLKDLNLCAKSCSFNPQPDDITCVFETFHSFLSHLHKIQTFCHGLILPSKSWRGVGLPSHSWKVGGESRV